MCSLELLKNLKKKNDQFGSSLQEWQFFYSIISHKQIKRNVLFIHHQIHFLIDFYSFVVLFSKTIFYFFLFCSGTIISNTSIIVPVLFYVSEYIKFSEIWWIQSIARFAESFIHILSASFISIFKVFKMEIIPYWIMSNYKWFFPHFFWMNEILYFTKVTHLTITC